MISAYNEGEIFRCPCCDRESESPVEDYVAQGPHGLIGHWYQDQCGWCDEWFSVAKLSNGSYEVKEGH